MNEHPHSTTTLPGTALEPGRVAADLVLVDPASRDRVSLWDHRQRAAVVLAFLHAGCEACRAFARDLAAVTGELEWAGAVARAVVPVPDDLAVSVLVDAGDVARRRLLDEDAEVPVVVVLDRYGAAIESYPAAGHGFPTPTEIVAAVTHLAVQCPECGVSDWPDET